MSMPEAQQYFEKTKFDGFGMPLADLPRRAPPARSRTELRSPGINEWVPRSSAHIPPETPLFYTASAVHEDPMGLPNEELDPDLDYDLQLQLQRIRELERDLDVHMLRGAHH